MQGLFILQATPAGHFLPVRPKTKKEVRALLTADMVDRIVVEATSLFGGEYQGPLSNAPLGAVFTVCGPDPYVRRSWYATITRGPKGKWVMK